MTVLGRGLVFQPVLEGEREREGWRERERERDGEREREEYLPLVVGLKGT